LAGSKVSLLQSRYHYQHWRFSWSSSTSSTTTTNKKKKNGKKKKSKKNKKLELNELAQA
jgi:hypothetical protein